MCFKWKNPNVSLLNNGAEEGKGPDYIKEAYKIMKEENFPGFIGNCESRYALDGKHDVVVASGLLVMYSSKLVKE